MQVRADRVLVWLGILTLIVGGIGTLAVVFLADMILTGVSEQPVSIDLDVELKLSEEEVLHHWLVYKASVAQHDMEANYHVEQAFALAVDADHQSLLDGLLRQHLPSGHFFHARDTMTEILELAEKHHEPEPSLGLLHARLAEVLLENGDAVLAQEQVEHLVALATGSEKEQGQQILNALTAGDSETASQLLAELSGEEEEVHSE